MRMRRRRGIASREVYKGTPELQNRSPMPPDSVKPESCLVADSQRTNVRAATSDYGLLCLVAVLSVVAIVSRRPDAVWNPQFWGDDGAYFYADAYAHGWHVLLRPLNGYVLILPRLGALVATLFPLRWAPLVINLIAIAIQALPALILVTKRFAFLGTWRMRLLIAVFVLATPTSPEIHANLDNSQWYMALLAFLVLVAEPSTSKAWRVFDVVVVLFSGMTGPFCIFLLPVAAIMRWVRGTRWATVLLVINCITVAIQVPVILITGGRSHAPLGATPGLLIRIVGGHVLLGPLLGPQFTVNHPALAGRACSLVFAVALVVIAYVLRKGPVHFRLLALFAGSLLAASLLSPQAALTRPQWPVLLLPLSATRYWFIPGVAWLWTLVWMVGPDRPAFVRFLGALAVAAALCTGIAYWRLPAFVNYDFPRYAREFQQVPPGTEFTIPINPPGWKVTLRKK